VLPSVISVFFLSSSVVMMYMQETGAEAPRIQVDASSMAALNYRDAADLLSRHPANAGPQPRRPIDRDDF
jgi:hypothetical protein